MQGLIGSILSTGKQLSNMAKNQSAPNESSEDMQAQEIERGQSGYVYVEQTSKFNGTWYKGGVVPINDLMSIQSLFSNGAVRHATDEEIEEYEASQEAQRKTVFDRKDNLRMLDMRNTPEAMRGDLENTEYPAVDEEGNPIANSVMTDERKMRDEEGNTNTASVPQGEEAAKELESAANAQGAPTKEVTPRKNKGGI
jgi:hypothetical protein